MKTPKTFLKELKEKEKGLTVLNYDRLVYLIQAYSDYVNNLLTLKLAEAEHAAKLNKELAEGYEKQLKEQRPVDEKVMCDYCQGHGEVSKPPYDDSGICPICDGSGVEKEKAKALVDKFRDYAEWPDMAWNNTEEAKQCALIAIDEQIKLLDKFDNYVVIQNELVELHKQRKEIEAL